MMNFRYTKVTLLLTIGSASQATSLYWGQFGRDDIPLDESLASPVDRPLLPILTRRRHTMSYSKEFA